MAETVFYKERKTLSLVSLVVLIALLLAFWVWPFVKAILVNMERTAFEQRVASLQRVVDYKVAEYMALESLSELPKALEQNPWHWQSRKDWLAEGDAYSSEILEQETLDFEAMPVGAWAYERESKRLVYKVRHVDYLQNADPLNNRIQFQLALELADINEDGVYDPQLDSITGLTLLPLYAYQWTNLGENDAN